MNRRRLEALAEAIAHVNGYPNPAHALYQARNPGGLRPTNDTHARDAQGNRVFRSMLDGMQALLYDLEIKVNGRLAPGSTLADLTVAYHQPAGTAKAWARFLKTAMSDDTISPRTVLKDFLEAKQ